MTLHVADGALLAGVLIVLSGSRAYSWYILRKDAAAVRCYKLYAVRDKLIYLVASDKLTEEDIIFRTFYKAVNFYCSSIERVTLSRFVASIADARRKGLDPAEKKKMEEIHSALNTKGPEITEVVVDFYNSMMSILIANSFMLRFFLQFEFLSTMLGAFAKFTKNIRKRSTHRRAYWFYQDYAHARSAL